MTNPYRVIVTGSRDWTDAGTIRCALDEVYARTPAEQDFVLVHGGCPTGADAIAHAWGRKCGAVIEPHPAKGHPTEDFGPWPAAGPRRNAHMVNLGADLALAFIGPCSRSRCRRPQPHPSHGASGCAALAERAGIPVRKWTA